MIFWQFFFLFTVFLCLSQAKNETQYISFCAEQYYPGVCRMIVPRFYYNVEKNECEGFTYGGCHAHANNFDTKEVCEETCHQSEGIGEYLKPTYQNEPICKLQFDRGSCKAYFERFFFDTIANKCKKFVYGGCEGNKNRFETEEECLSKCGQK